MSASKPRSSKKAAEESNPDFALTGIGNYTFVKTLGEGNFAKVKLAKHKLTGQEVAIKVIDKTQLDEKKVSKLYREVRIMKLLHHPHIVRLYEVIETKSTVFLVMEYSSGGELYDYLVVHGRMKEKDARAKFRQILSAVSYCHKKKVIHRDLKAENLLLDGNLDIKIADFGFSNLYDPDSKLDTFCGSPPYAAPELFQGRRYTGPEVDVWSLGVILYVLTTGCLPFDGKNLQEMRENVCRGKYRIPFYLSETCEKLLRKFLIRDPAKRASLDIIIDDPWINESYSDSPVISDLSMKPVTEDEQLMKVMESKFHIDRNQILKCLREGIYDDIAAIYYLLYHERDQKGEISNIGAVSTKVVPPPPSAGGSVAVKKESDMVPIDEDDVLQNNAPAGIPKSADVVDSDSMVPNAVPRSGGRGSNVSRRRRFTVGGEAEMQKFADSEENREVAAQLKLLQQTAKPEGDKAPPNPNPSSISKQEDGDKVKSNSVSSTAPPSGVPTLAGTSNAATSPPPAPALEDGEDRPENGAEPSGRKRHNTIVGLLRNTVRRQSVDVGNSTSPQIAMASNSPMGSVVSTTATISAANGRATPDGTSAKPRSLRFTFNSNTTSSKPPDEVVTQVVAAANKHGIQHRLTSPYLIECSAPLNGPPTPGKEVLKFEIEICKLPRLRNLHGLRFKRLSGASSDYKDVCELLLAAVAL